MEAVNLDDRDYVVNADRKLKKAKQTVWTFRVLDFEQSAWLEEENFSEAHEAKYILAMGLQNVKNFTLKGKEIKIERVKDGKDVEKYPGDVLPLTNKFLSHIDRISRGELSLKIRFNLEIEETEAKNS